MLVQGLHPSKTRPHGYGKTHLGGGGSGGGGGGLGGGSGGGEGGGGLGGGGGSGGGLNTTLPF